LVIIKEIIQNDNNKDIFKQKEFLKFLSKQKHIYYLDEREYNNLLIILDLYEPKSELFNEANQKMEETAEKK
jgi:hypothetical protein